MKKILFGFAAFGMAFSACTSNNHSNVTNSLDATKAQIANPPSDTISAFSKVHESTNSPIKRVIEGYINLKNSLALDKGYKASLAGIEILKALPAVDTTSLNPDQCRVFAKYAMDVKKQAEIISQNPGKIEFQRQHFELLSNSMLALVKSLGGGLPLYLDFCPMAFNSKGARWLSEQKEIKNPYFGNEMLACGEIKDTLR